MHAEDRDAAYLWDILEAAKEVELFVRDMKFYEFENNKIVRMQLKGSFL